MQDVAPRTLELLLADAADLRPTLAAGLPEIAAGNAPRPEKTPRGVDALSLEMPDANPNDLALQRWSVIAPEGAAGDRALEAIAPLLRLREGEQGAKVAPYRVKPGMGMAEAARWKNDVLHDERVPEAERPRYLLLLGDLDEVSIELQHVLANGSFVGRLHVAGADGKPDLDGYAAYADKVVRWAVEPTGHEQPDALFFVADDGTDATRLGHSLLIEPCLFMAQRPGRRRFPAANVVQIPGADTAADFLGGVSAARPSVLLSVSHGLGRPRGGWASPDHQRAFQGALVVGGPGGSDRLLTAEGVQSASFLPGGLWFCVACFGAGTPKESAFYPWLSLLAREGAFSGVKRVLESLPSSDERPFLAALPQAALRNPKGPLAVIAHLDLAWTYGFTDPSRMTQSRASRIFSSVQAAARGSRAGVALDALMRSYREVNDELLSGYHAEEDARVWNRPSPVEPIKRSSAFMLRNDLRGYVLLGDPAARLPLKASGAQAQLPSTVSGLEHTTAAPPEKATPTRGLVGERSSAHESMPTRTAGHDPARREEAVIAVLRGDEAPRAIAERYGVSRAELDRWVEVYREAGRSAVGKLP
ncbi:transposase [Sorangium sp. So ce131]|uniref:transposase n=1 Tax=Sorangium sp. So ce131 TaxID=3133282 RepID=UPI003F5FF3E0